MAESTLVRPKSRGRRQYVECWLGSGRNQPKPRGHTNPILPRCWSCLCPKRRLLLIPVRQAEGVLFCISLLNERIKSAEILVSLRFRDTIYIYKVFLFVGRKQRTRMNGCSRSSREWIRIMAGWVNLGLEHLRWKSPPQSDGCD